MNVAEKGQSLVRGSAGADPQRRYFETDHLLEDLHGRSFRGGVVTLGGQAVKFLLQMGSTAILARLLDPQDFGLIAMVMAITGFIAMFKDAGLSEATIQRLEITPAQVSLLFWVNCSLSVVAMVVVAIFAPVIAWFYHEPRLLWVTLALSGTFVLTGLTVQHQALLQRQMRFTLLAIIEAVSLGGGIIIGIVMGWFGFGYWALVALSVATSLLNCILVWVTCKWRPERFARKVGARSMLSFGGGITGFNVLNYFTRNFDNILIGRVLGSIAIGIYSKAYALLALPINQINLPIGSVVVPGLGRLQNHPQEYRKFYLTALGAISLITVPLVIFCCFLAKDLVLVLLGPKWLQVAPVFQLLGPAALVGAINVAPGWLFISLGRAREQLHCALVTMPICVTAFLIGVKWGIAGVAASLSLTLPFLFCGAAWYASRQSPVKFSEIARTFYLAFLPAFVSGLAAYLMREQFLPYASSLIALTICGSAFGIFYLGTATLLSTNRDLILVGLGVVRQNMSSLLSKKKSTAGIKRASHGRGARNARAVGRLRTFPP